MTEHYASDSLVLYVVGLSLTAHRIRKDSQRKYNYVFWVQAYGGPSFVGRHDVRLAIWAGWGSRESPPGCSAASAFSVVRICRFRHIMEGNSGPGGVPHDGYRSGRLGWIKCYMVKRPTRRLTRSAECQASPYTR